MSWHKITLRSNDGGEGTRLQDAFAAVFMAHGGPKDAAMFTDYDDRFDDYFYYFSPGAYRIAAKMIDHYKAVESAAPKQNRVSLLVGDADAFSLLA